MEPTIFSETQHPATDAPAPQPRVVARPDMPALRLEQPGAADRVLLERRIAAMFARQYRARIEHFLPLLVSLDLAGQSGAIAGLRCAGDARLFMEQYLDSSVEQAVSRSFREPVDRSQIVEIGNLVSVLPGAASMLFAVLPELLDDAGVRWVVCTATPQVRAMLHKLGFQTRTLGKADPAVLGEQADAWGTYYESRPTVIAGDVRMAVRQARRDPRARRLQRLLSCQLADVADVIRKARG